MKRKLLLVQGLLVTMILKSQTPYPPAPPPPGNMVQFEYFLNTDPGFGNGTLFTIPSPQPDLNNFVLSIPTTGLPQGFYRLYLRSRDANGQWSHTMDAFFSNVVAPVYPAAPPAAVNIVKLEYAIDANPPFGSGTDIPITPGLNVANQNVSINTSGVPAGPHILYIRSQDANGVWSLTGVSFFDNSVAPPYPVAPAAAGNIQQLEYFIDTDPGFGLATPVTYTPATDVTVSFPVNGLSAGNHVFYIRSRQNPWGLVTAQPFSVISTLPVTWLYVQGKLQTTGALIKWATASESNTANFETEHSTDGIAYTKIGITRAAGNSTSTSRYEFLHASPATGKNFYRIRQVDLDGRFTYSAVVVLYNITAKNVLITPNPVQHSTIIYFKEASTKTIRLLKANGQLVLTQLVQPGSSSQVLDMNNLPVGLYLLQVQAGNETEVFKIIKQ
jgi:hypothetical protein